MTRKIIPLMIAFTLLFVSCNSKNKKEETVVPSTPAQQLCAEFKSKVTSNASIDMETLAAELSQSEAIKFGAAFVSVEEGYLNGFDNEIKGFSSGAFFGPMIGSIPFVGYVFEVAGDEKAFMKTLEENANLRWNVCTQADEMVCDSVGKKVFFVMSPKSFDEE